MKGFIYDTHVHTSESSACAQNCARDVVRAYKEAGYTGIVITDHFFYGNTAVDRDLPWKEWVEEFCKGYEHAKEEGDKCGLQVFFGWESGYHGPEFLIYGLDKEWLLAHEEIRDASVPRQLELVHDGGGIVIQAHPFREADYIEKVITYPDYVDGVEAYNASHITPRRGQSHPEYNHRAVAYAREHDFPMTAGSDLHCTDIIYGGMEFPRRIEDIHDFARAVIGREAIKLWDGTEKW